MEAYITKNQAIHAMEQVTQPECFIEDTRKDFAKIIVDGEKYLVHDTREYCYLGGYLATWGGEQA